ncbi:MAG: fimbrillin family protein [Bacteroidales bacterium]
MKTIKTIRSLMLLLMLVAGVAGCRKDELGGGEPLPGGKQPLEFTSQMYGMEVTRATAANTWSGSEEVAVQIGSDVKKYTASTGGKITAATGVIPFYWTSITESKTVSAWVPYSTNKPTSFSVSADQSGAGYQQSDMIYANATTIAFSDTDKKLTFKHLPAKVVVNLKAGDGVTATQVQGATVTLVNQHLTSGTINETWSVAQQATLGSNTITPNVLETPASNYHKTVQALVVPQQLATAERFISITIGTQEFVYSTKLNFVAGMQYTYNITVAKNSITVTTSGAEAWTETGTTTNVTSKDIVAGYAESDLKIGDYYYSNGTWSDGGYRRYSTSNGDTTYATLPIMPVLTDANGNARTVVGIVYWVGDITNEDALLKKYHSTCTHGLVVALHDAGDKTLWSTSCEQVNTWTNATERSDKVNITEEKKMQGYSNTVALTAYNKESSNVQSNAKLKVLPIAAIEQYNTDHPAPVGSSGWYWPSIMELNYMCWGQGNHYYTKGKDMLETQFNKVSGASSFTRFFYWSSSEKSSNNDKAWFTAFSGYDPGHHFKEYGYYYVRGTLAF